MPEMGTARAGHGADFANGERREVVVKHEAALLRGLVALQPLSIVRSAKRRADQGLRLATRKQRRAVNSRQNPNLNRDLANLIEGAMIRSDAVVQNLIAEDVFAKQLIVLAQLLRCSRISFRQLLLQLILDRLDQRIAIELRMLLCIQRILQLRANLIRQAAQILLIDLLRRDQALRLTRPAHQILNRSADLLDLLMSELDSIHNAVLGDFLRAGLDHHDAVLRAHNHDVQLALRTLGVRGVHDELAVYQANPHSSNRSMERDVAQRKRTAGAIDTKHVRIVLLVGRVDKGDNLRLIAKRLWEEGADRTVDLTARQNLLLAP